MGHHFRREQRRAGVIALVGFILFLVMAVPFATMPQLRLDAVETLGLVANRPSEKLFDAAAGVELISVFAETPVEFSLPIRSYTAVYVAETREDGVVLHDLAANRAIDLSLARFDRARQSTDGTEILLAEDQGSAVRAVAVTIATGQVRDVSAEPAEPDDTGRWSNDVSVEAAHCNAISPDGDWVACATGTRGIYGDWQLYIHPTGQLDEKTHLLRGIGAIPVLGWSADSQALYYQDEDGVYTVSLDSEEDGSR